MDPNVVLPPKVYKRAGESDWEAYDRRRRAATPVPIKPEDQAMLRDFDSGPSESTSEAVDPSVEAKSDESTRDSTPRASATLFRNPDWNKGTEHLPLPSDDNKAPSRRSSTVSRSGVHYASNSRTRERLVDSRQENTTPSRSETSKPLASAAPNTRRFTRYSLPAVKDNDANLPQNGERSDEETMRGRSPTQKPLGEGTSTPGPAAVVPNSPELQQGRIDEAESESLDRTTYNTPQNNAATEGPALATIPLSLDSQATPHTSGSQSDNINATGRQESRSSLPLAKAESKAIETPHPELESAQGLPEHETNNVKRSKLSRVVRTLVASFKRLVKHNPAPTAQETSDVIQPAPPVVKRGLLAKLKNIAKPRTPPNPAAQAQASVHQGQGSGHESALLSQLPTLDYKQGHRTRGRSATIRR
ncbi:hypothetical protein V8B97DRAFT_2003514 [Scleroderma yunnanense]